MCLFDDSSVCRLCVFVYVHMCVCVCVYMCVALCVCVCLQYVCVYVGEGVGKEGHVSSMLLYL